LSQFEARYDDFRAMGAEIVGISVDSHHSHAAFATSLGLRFPLVSDFNRQIVEEYAGYFDDVGGYRLVNRRCLLVLDPQRVVRWTWAAAWPAEAPDTECLREAVQDVVYG